MTVASRLQAGGQALQVFKGGKPNECFLYKDMAGWQAEEDAVYIELNSGRELLYTSLTQQQLVTWTSWRTCVTCHVIEVWTRRRMPTRLSNTQR